jgi:hypothetical protein
MADAKVLPFGTIFAATARRQASTLSARVGWGISGPP